MKKLKLQLTEILSATISSLSYPTKLFSLTPPKNHHFGDLSSNLALLLAKDLKKNPMEIGKTIINELNQNLPIFISDIRYCMSPTFVPHQERVALSIISRIFSFFAYVYKSSISIICFSCRYSFRNNFAFGIFS